jgi:hypothetical protein
MEQELSFIEKRGLSKKETFEFYINIGDKPSEILLKMGFNADTPYEQLCSCIGILNEEWWPNWENENECKWCNYWAMKGGFSCYNTIIYGTGTIVPSALCLKDETTAKLAKSLLLDLYEKVYTTKPNFMSK